MKKSEFLRELESRLQILNEAERKDIIDEYSQHIELKIANGLNEEEAARDFGDIKELSGEILSAYNVNLKYNKPDVTKTCMHIGKQIKEVFKKMGLKIGEWWKVIKDKVKHTIDKNNEYSTIRNNRQLELLHSNESIGVMVNEKKLINEKLINEKVNNEKPNNEKLNKDTYENKFRSNSLHIGKGGTIFKTLILGIWRGAIKIILVSIWLPIVLTLLISIFIFGCCIVLNLQGYPLIGIMLGTGGSIICAGTMSYLLGSFCFSRKGRGENNEQVED